LRPRERPSGRTTVYMMHCDDTLGARPVSIAKFKPQGAEQFAEAHAHTGGSWTHVRDCFEGWDCAVLHCLSMRPSPLRAACHAMPCRVQGCGPLPQRGLRRATAQQERMGWRCAMLLSHAMRCAVPTVLCPALPSPALRWHGRG